MQVELDHVFVCASPGAPEADRLVAFGLSEGAANQHPGQGTACRRFFFHNAYLELLWVTDEEEARSPAVVRTGLRPRWSGRSAGASPFGVCLRPSDPAGAPLPFATWDYCPAYLPAGMAIQIGTNCERASEPFLALMPVHRRPDASAAPRRQPLEHARGLRLITSVRLSISPAAADSPELNALSQACSSVSFVPGAEPLMELCFDGQYQHEWFDLRPELPLVLRW